MLLKRKNIIFKLYIKLSVIAKNKLTAEYLKFKKNV